MEKLIDLHVHTTASDGSMSPGDIVRHAKSRGLSAIAITDHDTVDGIAEALEEGKKYGIEVIPGIEIGVEYKPEMHILGYFSKSNYMNIKSVLQKLLESRSERNPKIINKLKEMGFDISIEEVEQEALGNVVGRPHIAKVLIKKGYVQSIEEAFEKFLKSGRPAYFKKDKLTPEEGIREILEAGGIPVLAHPIYLDLDYKGLDELLERLAAAGLRGIEAYYVENKGDDTGNLLRLAKKHNLLATGGSDYHGSFKPDIDIAKGHGNLKIPYELLDAIRQD